jgi:hypothetical protein
VLAGAALVVALVLTGVAVVLSRDGGGTATGSGGSTAVGTGSGDSARSSAPSASAPVAPKTTPSAVVSSPATASAAASGVPAGYYEYHDGSGFSITLPEWLADQGEDYDSTSRKFGGRGVKLVVDWTSPSNGSAVDDWMSGEKSLGASNYHRVQLQAITYRQWTNAADWEWTYGSKTTMHSLNRGFVTGNGKYGYAIYWTMPDADWAANAAARQVSFDTFQPAP